MKIIFTISLLSTFSAFSQTFTESSISLGVTHEYLDTNIMGGGAAFFDVNNDGWEDIYITGGENRDQLFLNDQTGNFTEIGMAAGLGFTAHIMTNGVIAGDVNNDGYRDLFITTSKKHHNYLLYNNGDNTFTDLTSTLGSQDSVWSMTSSFGDIDGDAQLDIYVGNYAKYIDTPFFMSIFGGYQNKLYHSILTPPSIGFTEASNTFSIANTGSALATTFTDFDNDRDPDIIVGNDFGNLYGGNSLYRNEIDQSSDFSNISIPSQMDFEINAMGIAIGDYDEDLDLDYYITNMADNLLHTQGANSVFSEDAISSGVNAANVVSWGTFFFDYDNDTYLDLFAASGGIMFGAFPEPNRLFENQQNGTFNEVSFAEGIQDTCRSRGAIYGDIDNDGDLDILVVNTEIDSVNGKNVSLYRNNTNGANNWLKLKLIGTDSGTDAFGSRIELISNGRHWIREIDGGSSYLSHNSSIAHFGLGSYTDIDSVIIYWNSGAIQFLTNLSVNNSYDITEIDMASVSELESSLVSIHPNPSGGMISIDNAASNSFQYKIVDIHGKVLIQGETKSPTETIALDSLSDGVYLVHVTNGTSTSTTKIILKR